MIKVVIADDEQRFRLYMEKVLDWEALGFKICGSAANGEQVMELLKTVKPDIALLDINMPKMDGILLTEKLKEISPDTYVVFITGYSEFEYAQKAVKLGVSEYLLKPFSKEELCRIVLKLKENIQREKEKERQNERSRRILQEEMWNKMMRLGQEEREEIRECRESLEQLGVFLETPYYMVSIVQIDKAGGREIKKEDRELWLFGIRNILEELGNDERKEQVSFYNYERNFVTVWKCRSREETNEIAGIMDRLCDLVYEFLNVSVTIGVGSIEAESEGICQSYRKASISLQNKFLFGGRRVISYEDITKRNQKADFYRLDLNEQLLGCLRKNDMDKTEELLHVAEKEIVENNYSIDYVNAAIMGILSVCLSYIVEMKGDIRVILGQEFLPYQELKGMESLKESFGWLKEIFKTTICFFKRPRSKRAEQIIEEVEHYIELHYSDFGLTAEDISEAVYLDISYIRKVFSRYKDYTIQEYITSVRMKAAKEKLEQQVYTIGEIAEKCGYLDSGYFSKCFRKYYHVSPRQYISQLQDSRN